MSGEEKDTKIEIVQDVDAKETNENVETVESDRLLDETAETDIETLIEARCAIVAESGVITTEKDVDIPHTKLPALCEKIETNVVSSAFGSVTTIKSAGRKQTINARTVLWYFSFVGFALNYMLRVNINIAITEMVTLNESKHTHQTGACMVNGLALSNTTMFNSNLTSSMVAAISSHPISYTMEQHILDFFGLYSSPAGIHWNEVQKNRVLGAYFWIHWMTQIPGGLLAKRYGTKLVFGATNFVVSAMCFIIPMAAYWDIRALITLRILQGFIAGVQWPSMHHLAAQWIPPDERSSFVTSYLGSSVGLGIFYPLFGYILSTLSWEWVFYVSGMVGTVWYMGWLYFVYDSPAKHPRIDPYERQYIEKSLDGIVHHDRKGSVPWKEILRSKPIWTNVICQWGSVWGLYTLMTQTPTYFRAIHGWNVQWVGWLSGLPHFLRMGFAYFFSQWCDSMLRQNKMSRTSVRKLACALCTSINSIFVLALAFSGCNTWIAVACVTCATMIHGAVSTGPLANVIDISPNYSGIILGLTGTISVFPGFISPYIVGKLTLNNQTVQQWQYVFLIATVCMLSCGLFYQFTGKSELQSWNQPKEKRVKEVEMEDTSDAAKAKKKEAQIKANVAEIERRSSLVHQI